MTGLGAGSPLLLTAHDAKRCARRIHNDWDPSIEKVAREAPADVQARLDAGLEFEDRVLAAVAAAYGLNRCVDLRRSGRRASLVAATADAVRDRVDVVLGGWLPDDEVGGRTGRPDLLVHVGGGQYVPGEVKGHKMLKSVKTGATPCADIEALADPADREGLGLRASERLGDYLQLSHYWRMLEAVGWAPDRDPAGLVIGTDAVAGANSEGHWVATWLDLGTPLFTTYSRSSGKAKRSALERYDHEHGFRLKVAAAAASGGPALVEPVFVDECKGCPWFDHCTAITDDQLASRHIVAGGLDVREWTALRTLGVIEVQHLAALDVEAPAFTEAYLPEVSHQGDPLGRLRDAVRRARMVVDGRTLERNTTGPISVRRARVEIDLDIEWDPSDRVYLWGALLGRDGDSPTYHAFVDFDPLDEASERDLARRFASWLREQVQDAEAQGRSLLVFHYSHPEPRYLRRILGDEASDLVERFVDLLPVVREHFFGLDGLGIKAVAPAFGFTWHDEDPGGLQSQLWLSEARAATDEETRVASQQRILAYNEDDVRATHAIRSGL